MALLYCKYWKAKLEDFEKDKMILTKKCRKGVMHNAHSVPMAGQLGRKKDNIKGFEQFVQANYVKRHANICRSCVSFQKSTHTKIWKAPIISLQVMMKPIEHIGMDIVGPLLRRRSGGCRYIKDDNFYLRKIRGMMLLMFLHCSWLTNCGYVF